MIEAPRPTPFEPGTLAAVIDRVRAAALASGALQPIQTEQELVEDGGVRFVVRRVSSLDLKRLAGRRRADPSARTPANPFLPPEPALLLAEVSDTHRAVLNKYYVLDGHLLIVTRAFVDQEALLDERDFAALETCMAELPSLGFYNGGIVAGASQPHKHLQMVPLPLAREGPAVPIEPLFAPVAGAAGIVRVPALAFPHAFAWREAAENATPARLAALYRALLEAIGVRALERGGMPSQSSPYSLLVAERWMLAVPRVREHFGTISVNALGFAGSLFVRDADELAALRRAGPMAALRAVAG
ncbi:MAG: phosphorylase [Burkholderiales bacterium]|nr:phosphorylase [Burkholderiales bacterium]